MEVISDKQTGETLLDEALKLMKGQQDIEKFSVNGWIDLMSGAFVPPTPCVMQSSSDDGGTYLTFLQARHGTS